MPRGTYRTALNGGRKADIKYGPDGLSPILVIKVIMDSSQIKASQYYVKRLDCYCYSIFANTNVIYSFSRIIRASTHPDILYVRA